MQKFLGLDFSMCELYRDSNGKEPAYPRYYRNAEKKLAREQRKLSKMQKGSNNRNKEAYGVKTSRQGFQSKSNTNRGTHGDSSLMLSTVVHRTRTKLAEDGKPQPLQDATITYLGHYFFFRLFLQMNQIVCY